MERVIGFTVPITESRERLDHNQDQRSIEENCFKWSKLQHSRQFDCLEWTASSLRALFDQEFLVRIIKGSICDIVVAFKWFEPDWQCSSHYLAVDNHRLGWSVKKVKESAQQTADKSTKVKGLKQSDRNSFWADGLAPRLWWCQTWVISNSHEKFIWILCNRVHKLQWLNGGWSLIT